MCDCEYTYSWPIIYGGNVGDYQLVSPFNGPAEMAVLAFFPTAAGSCSAFISPSKNKAGDSSSIAATSLAGTQGTPGFYFDGSATAGIGFSPVFWPIDGSCSMVISNGGALVTCIWRRKLKNTSSHNLAKALPAEGTTNG